MKKLFQIESFLQCDFLLTMQVTMNMWLAVPAKTLSVRWLVLWPRAWASQRWLGHSNSRMWMSVRWLETCWKGECSLQLSYMHMHTVSCLFSRVRRLEGFSSVTWACTHAHLTLFVHSGQEAWRVQLCYMGMHTCTPYLLCSLRSGGLKGSALLHGHAHLTRFVLLGQEAWGLVFYTALVSCTLSLW